MIFFLRFFFLFLLNFNLWAENTSWYAFDSEKKVLINVELFLTSTCSHCLKADYFFKDIEKQSPWLRIKPYFIDKDKEALMRFNQLLIEKNLTDFYTPSIFFCNTRWVGFESDETTGKDLLRALNYCKEQIQQNGKLTKSTEEVLSHLANGSMFNSLPQKNLGIGHYLVVLALLDAFSPCALFGIGGFFALLCLQDTFRKQWITGLMFVLVVGILHYVQQTQVNFFYKLLPWLRIPAALTGLFAVLGILFYYKKKEQHSLLFLMLFFLILIVQWYQQTCIMNWSYMFQQWLDNLSINPEVYNLFQTIYQVMYLVPLMIITLIYIFIIRTKKLISFKPLLKGISWIFLTALSLHLLLYPKALSYSDWSIIISIVSIVLGCFMNSKRNKRVK